MVDEDAVKYLTELATAFVDLDEELKDELGLHAEEIANEGTVPYDRALAILLDGAVLFKRRALVRAYEEAHNAAKEA
jgi:hypothetical protein